MSFALMGGRQRTCSSVDLETTSSLALSPASLIAWPIRPPHSLTSAWYFLLRFISAPKHGLSTRGAVYVMGFLPAGHLPLDSSRADNCDSWSVGKEAPDRSACSRRWRG